MYSLSLSLSLSLSHTHTHTHKVLETHVRDGYNVARVKVCPMYVICPIYDPCALH